MKVDGNCLCGFIKYTAIIDPKTSMLCHCTDCQVNSGTAFGHVVGVINNQFELEKGVLNLYQKIAESGNKRILSFCGKCGTRIYARPLKGESGFFGLRTGTVSQRKLLPPTGQIWKQSALDWSGAIETEKIFEKGPN
jgi:hypothetical protein